MSDGAQDIGITGKPAVPAEEDLTGTEYTADAIYGNVSLLTCFQVVLPEFILYEKQHLRFNIMKEDTYVGGCIKRQIAYYICTVPVFAHLVTGRREECQQNLIFRMLAAQTLHERPPLLKLAERCSMEPDVVAVLLNLPFQPYECILMPYGQLPCPFAEDGSDANGQHIEVNGEAIQFGFRV